MSLSVSEWQAFPMIGLGSDKNIIIIKKAFTRTNCFRKIHEIECGSWQRWLGWQVWRIFICKRPVRSDDHFQEVGLSRWLFVRGRSIQMIIWKRPDLRDDHVQVAGSFGWHLQEAGSFDLSIASGLSIRMINNINNNNFVTGGRGHQGDRGPN